MIFFLCFVKYRNNIIHTLLQGRLFRCGLDCNIGWCVHHSGHSAPQCIQIFPTSFRQFQFFFNNSINFADIRTLRKIKKPFLDR